MKKLLLTLFLLLLVPQSAYPLIVTDNVDRDKFQYEVGYRFSSGDTVASTTSLDVAMEASSTGHNFFYTIPRDGRVVGMAIAGNEAITTGQATFDITINGQVTGIQTVLEPIVHSAVGIAGKTGPQYAYIRQDRSESRTAQGFRAEGDIDDIHLVNTPYGKATPLVAGNRIGVQITTSSLYAPVTNAYVVVIYVLH